MGERDYVVGEIGFGPAWSDKLHYEMDDAGICTTCGHKMTAVRPGKAQCDYCELGEAYDKAQAEIRQLTAERDLIMQQRNIAYEKKNVPPYPDWVCEPCGQEFGRGMPEGHVATWHIGKCGICHKQTEVTEPRDFRHLKKWPLN